MADVMEFYHGPETSFLEILADELEGTFHLIAHAGFDTNIRYIQQQQRYFQKRYGPFLDYVCSEVGIKFIMPAYDMLRFMLPDNLDPEIIRQNALEGLGYLNFGGEYHEERADVFAEFR